MTDERQTSGIFDLVTRTVDEAGRRFVDPLRGDIAGLKIDVERVRLDVHDLKIRAEVRERDDSKAEKTVKEIDDRVGKIERWRAYVTGAVAVITALALTFGVIAYRKLDDVAGDVAAMKGSR